ncbi:MAG TPA: hypothetical protein PKW29_08875 [Clostridia bacterium]|jgi:hypothetical protein|nr:hypothetical protein [Clostridia bacterium]
MKVKGRRCRFTEDDLPETAENRHRCPKKKEFPARGGVLCAGDGFAFFPASLFRRSGTFVLCSAHPHARKTVPR